MGKHIKEEEDFELIEMTANNVSDQIGIFSHANADTNQYLRELFVNAIEAIPEGEKGTVRFDVDWNHYHEHEVYKLCVSDNGIGMTEYELPEYLNKTGSSSKKIGIKNNFGFGVKVSALPSNKSGLIYSSWTNNSDDGNQLTLVAKNGKYGIKQTITDDIYASTFKVYSSYKKPINIIKSGTAVTCLGNSYNDNTYMPNSETNVYWIARYLNSKFFKIPDNIEVSVMTPKTGKVSQWPKKSGDTRLYNDKSKTYFNHKILGAKEILSKISEDNGTIKLKSDNGKLHWWILKDKYSGNDHFIKEMYSSKKRGLSYIRNFLHTSHYATIVNDEVFNTVVKASVVAQKMNRLGISHGNNRIVMYFEPNLKKLDMHQPIDRQGLNVKHFDTEANQYDSNVKPFDLIDSDVCHQFPDKLKKFIKSEAEKVNNYDVSLSSYKNHLRKYPELYDKKVVISNGIAVEKDFNTTKRTSVKRQNSDTNAKYDKNRKDRNPSINRIKNVKARHKGKEVLPKIEKVPQENFQKRTGIEDNLLANYDRSNHLILFNANSTIYAFLMSKMLDRYPNVNKADKNAMISLNKIISEVLESYTVSTVMSSLRLEGGCKDWNAKNIDEFLIAKNLEINAWNFNSYYSDIAFRVSNKFGKPK